MTDFYDRPRSSLTNGALGIGVASSSEKSLQLMKAPPCSRCGAPMWLTRIEPHPSPDVDTDDMIYQCGCGEQLTRTVKSR